MAEYLTAADIQAAHNSIAPLVRHTPVEIWQTPNGYTIHAKMECWQTTGSFKMRGAANWLMQLSAPDRERGIVTASAGNHALGVATGAVALQIPAIIVVAQDASPAKVAALRQFDPAWVELRQEGRDYDEAEAIGIRLAQDLHRRFISPYNDPLVIAGQGTVALEMLADLPELDLLIVPVGGGGLVAGVGIWAKHVNPALRIIGVQSDASPSMAAALAAQQLTPVTVQASIADGLAGNIEAGSITFPLCQQVLDDMLLVSEDAIRTAIRWLAEAAHVIVEGSGAVGVAALLSGVITPPPASRIGVILTGRNITGATLRQALTVS